jgi:hypothetical protein
MIRHNALIAVYFTFITVFLLIAGRQSFFKDPGTFWHIRTGELILQERSFIDYDPFSFTFGGSKWTPYEWLGEVGMAAVHAIAGIDGILIVSCIILAIVFTFLYHRLTHSGLHPAAAVVITLLALACSSSHFHARPHLITILLLTIMYAVLVDIDAKRHSTIRLICLLPMFILWTNIHGGVLGGIGTMAIVLMGWLFFHTIGLNTPIRSKNDINRLTIILILVPLSTLMTPYGLEVPRTWLQIMSMNELPEIIKEHSPVNIMEVSSWPFFAFGAVYFTVICTLQVRPRITWLVPIVWFLLACDRVRHAPLFAVTATIGLIDLLPFTRIGRALAKRPDYYRPTSVQIEPPVNTHFALVITILSLVIGISLLELDRRDIVSIQAEFPSSEWPVDLIPHLHTEARSSDQPIPIFNEYEYGGFLIYFAPKYRPFVDDRCEVYGGKWLKKFDDAAKGNATTAMLEWQSNYSQFNFALVRHNSGFDHYFRQDHNWAVIAKGKQATFYKRIP